MEEYQESVVEASVDAEQHETPEVSPSETDVNTEVVAPTTEEPKFGEALKAELSRREAQLEKKYKEQYGDYDSIKSQTKYLEKQAKIYGYATVDEYTQAVDEYEKQQEIEQQAKRMNVDPETYAQYFAPVNQELGELRNKVQTYEQQQQQKEQQERNSQSWGELYKAYPHLAEESNAFNEGKVAPFFTEQMQQLVNSGYQPIHAYELAHKETLFKQREQEVIAKLTGRDAKQVLSSVDSPNNLAFDPANMTNAQIDDISRRVRQGERITF